LSIVGYSISRPGADGSPSSLTTWLQGFEHFKEDLEARNSLRTQMFEQAAQDKHLLLNAERNLHVELKMPEYVVCFIVFPFSLFMAVYLGRLDMETSMREGQGS
jgi:hypothetical protein